MRELRFPLVSGLTELRPGEEDALFYPTQMGLRIASPVRTLSAETNAWMNLPPGPGFFNTGGFRGHCVPMWPGLASMAWMDFCNESEGLYIGSHHAGFRNAALLARRRPDHGDFQLGIGRYPFVRPCRRWAGGPVVVRPHAGDWREGARRYRRHTDSWYRPRTAPAWLEKSGGIHLVTMKHQNGRIFHRYEDLVSIHRANMARGLNLILFVFGWYRAGHDNGFPGPYEADPLMGGEEALRGAIRTVQAEGGHMTLYTQGRLIDQATEYFRTGKGGDVCLKNGEGVPYWEEWSWMGESTIYPNKIFAMGCPSEPEWKDRLLAQTRTVLDHGADGILYDQIGATTSLLCFDPSHAHDGPDAAFAGKVGLLEAVQKFGKHRNADFLLIGEHVCDAFAQHLDFIHGAQTHPDRSHPASTRVFPAMFRYTFPELLVTWRSAMFSAASMNFCFMHGLMPELSMPDAPEHARSSELEEHFERLVRLRMALGDYLIRGKYLDRDGFSCGPEEVEARAYRGSVGGMAIVCWNTSERPLVACLEPQVPCSQAWRVFRPDKPETQVQGDNLEVPLAPGQIAVLENSFL